MRIPDIKETMFTSSSNIAHVHNWWNKSSKQEVTIFGWKTKLIQRCEECGDYQEKTLDGRWRIEEES